MPRRNHNFTKGCLYLIYNRGAGRAPIFFDDEQYVLCLRLVRRYMVRYAVTIVAYCLMPNHYHFLLRQDGDAPISGFIGAVFNAYVQAVNRKQQRSGTLFEGRFKHVLVTRDEYARHLCRYIHLNPVSAGLVSRPEEWAYSNYLDWLRLRGGTLKDDAFIRMYWRDPVHYRQFVEIEAIRPDNFEPAGGWESFASFA